MYEKYRCGRNGKIDGEKGIPRTDQISNSQFEEELVGELRKKVTNIEGKYIRYEAKLSYAENRKKTHEDELKKFEEEHNYPKCKEDYEKIKNEYYDKSKIVFLPIWLWLVLIGIAISEFPLNARAFLIFGADVIHTNIMALAICLGIPVTAHWYGKYLKDVQQKKQIDTSGIIIKWILVFLISVFLGISFLRGEYYIIENFEIPIDKTALSISIIVILFILNMFTFLVAGLTSYQAYNLLPNNSEEIKAEIRRLKKVIKDYKNKKIEKQRKWIVKRIKKSQSDIDAYSPKANKKKRKLQRKMEGIMHHYNKLIAIYRKENIRVREKTESEPVSFKRKLVFNNSNNEIIVSECKEVGYTTTTRYEDISNERIVDNEQKVTNPNGKH